MNYRRQQQGLFIASQARPAAILTAYLAPAKAVTEDPKPHLPRRDTPFPYSCQVHECKTLPNCSCPRALWRRVLHTVLMCHAEIRQHHTYTLLLAGHSFNRKKKAHQRTHRRSVDGVRHQHLLCHLLRQSSVASLSQHDTGKPWQVLASHH